MKPVEQVLQGTHTVEKRNFYERDDTLYKMITSSFSGEKLKYVENALHHLGERCANEIDKRAAHTDREGEPRLIRYNKYGEEVSEVWVNEGYKKTVKETYAMGIVGYVHKEIPELKQKGGYTFSFLQGYLLTQAEPGFYCPVTLTLATAYLLDHYASDEVKEMFLPHVCSTGEKTLFEGATFLTERQGGSDVGANVVRVKKDGQHYRLYGEKYFASNAGMCGVAMVLARIEGAKEGSRGLTLFAVPWRHNDGELNGLKIRRLKDKLGVRAVPSGEVEFNGSLAYVVGEADRGFYYMMEALNLSRVGNAVASVGIMRRAYTESIYYASRRNAFGKRLTDFPMIQDTLTTLKVKLHAEVATVFDLIPLYEKVTNGIASDKETILNRLFIALVKKETAEQSIEFCHEAIEMHGGNGYIEDFVTPRLLRDAQVLTVWEGTANILGLELVRLIRKYEAHLLFIAEMKERLHQLPDVASTSMISQQVSKVERILEEFATLPYGAQTFEAKHVMKQMVLLYKTMVVAQWGKRYGNPYTKMLDIFIEMSWEQRSVGDAMKTVDYFSDIVSL